MKSKRDITEQMNIKNIAVIGLGSMGMGVAESCISAGLDTYGIDLNPQALDRLNKSGAKGTSTDCRDFLTELDAIVLLVVDVQQVKAILFESGLANKLSAGTPVMISSTISSDDAKEIGLKLENLGLLMLDAPISGGAVKAAQGELTVMASGLDLVFEKLQPVLDAVAATVYKISSHIGDGSTVKTIHQLLAGVHIAAGAEAMAMAAKASIPLELMYEVITNAAGNSWMFEDRMKHVVEGDYTPRSMVDIFVKDLGLVVDTAKSLKFPSTLSSTALKMFVAASNAGFGKEDDSAVIKIFKDINLPKKEL
jgi:putative dehydrogenase